MFLPPPGCRHEVEPPAPYPVWGGWQVGRATWFRTADGWDQVTDALGSTVYPTQEACQAAIDEGTAT